jgi:hypothetical protein
MKDVNDGSTEPFIIFRDKDGGWHSDHTQNQFGETFEWVNDVMEQDTLSSMYRGADFSKASFPSVYDTVLRDRISGEYAHERISFNDNEQTRALTNFFEENVSAFTHEVTDYLTTLERPLAVLTELCPFNLATDQEGWSYNEHLTLNAIDYIERAVTERLATNTRDNAEPTLETADIEINVSEYKPILTTNLIGWQITLAENKEKPQPFLVEQRREPDLGIKNDIYYCGVTSDYLEAIVNAVLYYADYLSKPITPGTARVDEKAIEAIVKRLLSEREDISVVQTSPTDASQQENEVLSVEEINFDDALEALGGDGLNAIADALEMFRNK